MAHQIDEVGGTAKGGEEGYGSFEFEQWISSNGFNSIKQAFIDRDMNTLNTLNMDNNTNFVSLMSDYQLFFMNKKE